MEYLYIRTATIRYTPRASTLVFQQALTDRWGKTVTAQQCGSSPRLGGETNRLFQCLKALLMGRIV